ncbi:hypothetical protein DPMN_012673 [Dreissena polymorpha]|uniref:Uncharacterized protein n=2 Tax=Dreissena polymorpha TaxID=45954 RepID=A0A9D4N2X0_DREPO|nr:hypothetical protein DPMN_012673 [Dreissena polymorpha]
MKDRGVIALDWVKSVSKNTRKRSAVVLILPGITSDATNVSYLCKLASNKGYKPVVYNQRGFGNTELTTAMLLNNCDPSDLRQTIQCIQDRHRLPVVSIAYGTGCDLLLSYLGEFGSSARIFGGVCISACLENEDRPSQTLKRVYNVLHLLKLKSIICRNYYALSKQINFAEMMKCWSLKEFDKIVFSRFYNYKSVDEFEEQMHPMRDIDEICAPLLFINSLDDPLDSKCDLLFELCDEFPNFMAIVSPTGGHCGFYDSLFDVSWSDRLALTYIQSVLYFGIK